MRQRVLFYLFESTCFGVRLNSSRAPVKTASKCTSLLFIFPTFLQKAPPPPLVGRETNNFVLNTLGKYMQKVLLGSISYSNSCTPKSHFKSNRDLVLEVLRVSSRDGGVLGKEICIVPPSAGAQAGQVEDGLPSCTFTITSSLYRLRTC